MSQFDQHHYQALGLSAILTFILLVVCLLAFWQLAIFAPVRHSLSQIFWPFSSEEPQPRPDLAAIGQAYISTLAAYDLQQKAVISLTEATKTANNLWLVKYDVRQSVDSHEQNYHYALTIKDGRVLDYSVSVSSDDGKVSLTVPEPGQILSGATAVLVKGKATSGSGDLIAQVIDENGKVLLEQAIKRGDETPDFYTTVDLDGNTGKFTLRLRTQTATLSVPFMIAQAKPL